MMDVFTRWENHFTMCVYIYISEKAMAPHSSTLAWKIPWMEEPGRLQSIGSRRVGHDWATSLSLFTFTHWRRIWQPTPVFLPGESQGQGSLVGFRLWGRTVGHDWSDLAAAAVYIYMCVYIYIYISQIIMMYTLNVFQYCQLYLNKSEKIKIIAKNGERERRTEQSWTLGSMEYWSTLSIILILMNIGWFSSVQSLSIVQVLLLHGLPHNRLACP